jgi:hypothetical protein
MSGQRLRFLRMSAAAGERRNELVPKGVEVENAFRLVLVGNFGGHQVLSNHYSRSFA